MKKRFFLTIALMIATIFLLYSPVQAQYLEQEWGVWAALEPYNFLWPLWNPALSPSNSLGFPTPLVASLSSDTILPVQPVLVWDPTNHLSFLLYNDLNTGNLLYYSNNFSFWPPDNYRDPITGSAMPISLPNDFPVLPIDCSELAGAVDNANYTYSSQFGIPIETLLSCYDILGDCGIEDNDKDGFVNCEDNCFKTPNPDQGDNDSDLLGDACDEDDDNDGMPDIWETDNSLDPLVDSSGGDSDMDGLANIEEFIAGTNPQNADSDGDGCNDGREIATDTNPLDPNSFLGLPDAERNALITLFNNTNGDSWIDKSNWKDTPLFSDGFAMPGTEYTWHGIICLDDHVTEIQLMVNNLDGLIHPSIEGLTHLEHIDLSKNNLVGTFPVQLCNLSNLRFLSLQGNQLTGPIPTELENLSNLRSLYLNDNQLTGSIPTELSNLINLQFLDLSLNRLLGPIPPELEYLSNLERLSIHSNQLIGPIPPQIGNLSSLQYIYLNDNQLTGSIPTEIGGLSNLRHFNLSSNQLTGPIPTEIGNLTNLQMLLLNTNSLEGSIPPGLGNLSNLQHLYLWDNHLEGPIPPELANLSNLQYLLLGDNRLSGSIPPEIGDLSNLLVLNLSSNMLGSEIPIELINLKTLEQSGIDLRWNALYTLNPGLRVFLNIRQNTGDWESTQTIAPINLNATISSPVELTWTAIPYKADPGGYEVYYAFASDGPYTKWATTANKSEEGIILTSLPPLPSDGTYFFKVRTITEPHMYNQNTVISNFTEVVIADEDGDGVPDNLDNCRHIFNPDQENWDGDLFGDACDNCFYEVNDYQEDSDGDSLGDACDQYIDQIIQGPSGTIAPGDLIYIESCFQNNTTEAIAEIKRDCFNTFFEIRDVNNSQIYTKVCKVGPAYGIPNDIIYLEPGDQDCVICEITGLFPPGTLIDINPSDGSPEIYTVQACSLHTIRDPDLLPNGTCLFMPCVDIFNGTVCSTTPVTISIEGTTHTHVPANLSFSPGVWSPDDIQPVSAQISGIEGHTVAEVDTGTILLNGQVPITSFSIIDGVLTVQFNASDAWQSLGTVVPGSVVYPKVYGRVGTNDLFVAQSRVEIACPDIDTMTYDGDTLLFTEGAPKVMANLVATLRNDQGNVMDIDYLDYDVVTFTVTADGVEDIIIQAGLVDGIANANLELGKGIYFIKAEYTCSSLTFVKEAVLVVTDEGSATGGGWIVPEDDGLNTHPGVRANFSFNAKYKKNSPIGRLKFQYSDGYINIKSTSIEQLVITGGKIVQFKGWARGNGKEGYWFFINAIDNGKPGKGVDEFDLKIWSPGVDLEGDPTERAHGLLQGGNIVVRNK